MATEQTSDKESFVIIVSDTTPAVSSETMITEQTSDDGTFAIVQNDSSDSDPTPAVSSETMTTEQTSDDKTFAIVQNDSSDSDPTPAVSSETMTTEQTSDEESFAIIQNDSNSDSTPADPSKRDSSDLESRVNREVRHLLWVFLLVVGILHAVLYYTDQRKAISFEPSPTKAEFNRLMLITFAETVGEKPLASAVRNYTVAATFELHDLKQSSAEHLKSGLSVRNVWVVRAVAMEYEDEDLMEVVENFIRVHKKETYGSDEWIMSVKRDEEKAMIMMRILADP